MSKQIQMIQITPNELAELISESVKAQIQEILSNIFSKQKEQSDIITRTDVCDLLKVSYVTIHDWCNKDILKPYKIGNRTYFKLSEVMQTIENSSQINK